ncbi:MAG: metal ABC transporter ATP-binding protein [Actinobacteria bacterium ATB1]|nr:metal ABC transporter ATP-binding protein [Actinobacteria bacterium ATB1]
MNPAVTARSLTVGYGSEPVQSGIDLDIAHGKWLVLIGGNGSGKSTLLKAFAGLLPPLSGELTVLGRAPGMLPARVCYMGQSRQVNELLALRVRNVVAMGRYAHLGLLRPARRTDRERVETSMARTGVEKLGGKTLHELSGGQRQRVYLAQALAHGGDVFLLDEATAGIDAAGRELYMSIVSEETAGGATVVVATHDFDEAERADEVLLLGDHVIAYGPPREVLTRDNLLATFGVALTHIGRGDLAHGISHHLHGGHDLDPRKGD